MADHINDCQPKMISAAGEDNPNTQLTENDAIINDDDEENEYDVQPDNPMFVRVVKTCAMCGIYLCLVRHNTALQSQKAVSGYL